MKAVFFVEKEKYGSAKNRLYGDELVSRQSITIRDNSSVEKEKEGYYMLLDGEDEAIKKAREILKDSAKELKDKEAKDIIGIIEKQESSAADGFGAIFG
ncbi:MAG: hypothetical protein J7K54_02420 [Candidatus Aenigmarchaeota archaeon]|nr:hypothetical protein [Candidatus Aenigmarchaeota archaeon]